MSTYHESKKSPDVKANPDLVRLLEAACRSASATVQCLYRALPLETMSTGQDRNLDVLEKDSRDPRTVVSKADLSSEQIIISTFSEALGCTFLSEEAGVVPNPKRVEYRVIVDSLDGSKNFVQGTFGLYGISIGIERKGLLTAGAIALPHFNELIVAERGNGVYFQPLRGAKEQRNIIGVPKVEESDLTLSRARICVGRGGAHPSVKSIPPLSCLQDAANEATNYGSCSVGLSSVILGRLDALLLPGQRYWDFAGGLLIIRELAGCFGIWTDGWAVPVDDSKLASATQDSLFDIAVTRDHELFDEIINQVNGSVA